MFWIINQCVVFKVLSTEHHVCMLAQRDASQMKEKSLQGFTLTDLTVGSMLRDLKPTERFRQSLRSAF